MIQNPDQTFQTANNEFLEQSPLGLTLRKIGLNIGIDTGAVLNKYIKKKTDHIQILNKSGSSSRTQKSEKEEKNSEKSKKSKQSGKSDNSALSKKRNKK